MEAIQTFYHGYHFRSRLEARWAVFFDAGHIRYEYEPEGFMLENGTNYLPDFYLPDFDAYVEVKRDTPDGIREIKDKCLDAIVWGGPIKQIIILSDVPEGKSPDGGIWHFPMTHWNSTEPVWGWWFFHDSCNDNDETIVIGQSSSAPYPSPEWYLMNKNNPRSKNSIKAVTDNELRRYRGPYFNFDSDNSDLSITEHIQLQEDFNSQTFRAFKVARQARFEHGETPQL